MDFRIQLHELAEAELDKIFDDISAEAGPVTAGNYVGGIYEFIEGFATFAERGTARDRCRGCVSSATAAAHRSLSSWKATKSRFWVFSGVAGMSRRTC